jgi:hypothetical protein
MANLASVIRLQQHPSTVVNRSYIHTIRIIIMPME